MSSINYDLKKIKALVSDVDGVLSPNVIATDMNGVPIRMVNVKDRHALRVALKQGFFICIITGAKTESVKNYYTQLGIKHLYIDSADKALDLVRFARLTGVEPEQIAYIGDDMPDLEVMAKVGLPVAPSDAAFEILEIAKYISHCKGGEGVVRDVVEQVLKAQDKWK